MLTKHATFSVVVGVASAIGFSSVVQARAVDTDWQSIAHEKGITVDRRKLDTTKLLEFRGRGLIDVPLRRVLAVLADVQHRTEWMPNCVGAALIEKIDARNEVSYNRTHAPWPVADRDAVLRASTTVDVAAREVRSEFVSVEDARQPAVKSVVRMPTLTGHWYLRAVNGGKSTCVEYQIHANPGGILPQWLANASSKRIPLQTLMGLRKQVESHQYPEFETTLEATPEYQPMLESEKTAPPDDVCAFQ